MRERRARGPGPARPEPLAHCRPATCRLTGSRVDSAPSHSQCRRHEHPEDTDETPQWQGQAAPRARDARTPRRRRVVRHGAESEAGAVWPALSHARRGLQLSDEQEGRVFSWRRPQQGASEWRRFAGRLGRVVRLPEASLGERDHRNRGTRPRGFWLRSMSGVREMRTGSAHPGYRVSARPPGGGLRRWRCPLAGAEGSRRLTAGGSRGRSRGALRVGSPRPR
jgi:hypothetical protein